MLKEALASLLQYGLPIAGTALFIALVSRFTRDTQRSGGDVPVNRISPDRRVMWGLLSVTGAMVVLGLIGLAFSPTEKPAYGIWVLMGAVLSSPFLYSLHPGAALCWTESYVEGPAAIFSLAIPQPRARIAWEEIEAVGGTKATFWFVRARSGQKVYWNSSFAGWGGFAASLRRRRPDLGLPPDLG